MAGHGWTNATPAFGGYPWTQWLSFGIFWVLKFLIFNRIFRVDTAEEIDEHLNIEEVTGP